MFASAAITVAATTEPSSLKCWSMPTFRPSSTGFANAGASFFGVSPCSSTLVSSVIQMPSLELDLDVDAGGLAALADREAKALFEGDRGDERDFDRRVVARHDHLGPLRELGLARDIRGPDVELRAIA